MRKSRFSDEQVVAILREAERWGTPTVHLSCDFSKPSFFGDTLTFRLTVLKVGQSSVRLRHTIHCGDEHRWSVEQVLAASWLDTHTSMPWPDDVRAKLESLMAPEALPHQPVRAGGRPGLIGGVTHRALVDILIGNCATALTGGDIRYRVT